MDNIGFYDFLILPKTQQLAYVWRYGNRLESIRTPTTAYSRYSVNGFYFEIVMRADDNAILNVCTFNSGYRLEKYLNEIDLAALV
jgi:hypothetical protein